MHHEPTAPHFELTILLWDPISQLKSLSYTLNILPSVTILMLKQYLAPMLSYLPEHIDLLLSHKYPYPLADSMSLSSLHPSHRSLLAQPRGPMLHSFEPYLKSGRLDLQQMAATDIPYLSFWIRSPTLHELELCADHPRAREILTVLKETLLEPNAIHTLILHRRFPPSYAKLHPPLICKDDMVAFQAANPTMKLVLDPWIIGNEEAITW